MKMVVGQKEVARVRLSVTRPYRDLRVREDGSIVDGFWDLASAVGGFVRKREHHLQQNNQPLMLRKGSRNDQFHARHVMFVSSRVRV